MISYNLFYSVGYTMWYMAYELSAALSTRNVKQRSGNSIAGQVTKNIGTGIISILFPTILSAISRSVGGDKQGYLVSLAVMCAIAVPLTFIQYFYTRERITEERRATEAEENRLKELKEYCQKKGLDFDTENQKYLDKQAKKAARKAAKKAKAQK